MISSKMVFLLSKDFLSMREAIAFYFYILHFLARKISLLKKYSKNDCYIRRSTDIWVEDEKMKKITKLSDEVSWFKE